MLDNAAIRAQFPILAQTENGHPLVYLDSAATSQKPLRVIEALDRYYREQNANVHRGVYGLSERATDLYEGARGAMGAFLNAATPLEIIFVRGATEGINLVASSLGKLLKPGDEILISAMEHHSNIVPWQFLRDERGIHLRVIPMDERGVLDMDAFRGLLNERTRLVAVTHMSNALGTINPVREIVDAAKAVGALTLIDGAQAAPHMPIDVQALGCDFYVLSGHKMYGPTGIGVLYGRMEVLETLPPYQGGGDMIRSVTFEKTEFNVLPYRFEAGTPHIAGAIGLAEAARWMEEVGRQAIFDYEHELLQYATERLQAIDGLRLIGTAPQKGGVLSFVIDGAHPHDVATLIDQDGIAVRASHHCAQPVMDFFGVPATVRASLGVYNNREDIDRLVAALNDALEMLR
ncbi:aminotransferase class V-fold PLP-dependent enzyme [Sulfurivirga sp.]|uniref:aminotransferase class V-fold PLP-dependent enzyme n=1 Tax=Sulfurivirga sp. TaxID=2614236 RepID=UPI0025CC1C5A|nr:cysteine desulfurase [Sulfurivirga sp.]